MRTSATLSPKCCGLRFQPCGLKKFLIVRAFCLLQNELCPPHFMGGNLAVRVFLRHLKVPQEHPLFLLWTAPEKI